MTPVQLHTRLERLEAKKRLAIEKNNYRKAARIVDKQCAIIRRLNSLLDEEIALSHAGPRRAVFLPEN